LQDVAVLHAGGLSFFLQQLPQAATSGVRAYDIVTSNGLSIRKLITPNIVKPNSMVVL